MWIGVGICLAILVLFYFARYSKRARRTRADIQTRVDALDQQIAEAATHVREIIRTRGEFRARPSARRDLGLSASTVGLPPLVLLFAVMQAPNDPSFLPTIALSLRVATLFAVAVIATWLMYELLQRRETIVNADAVWQRPRIGRARRVELANVEPRLQIVTQALGGTPLRMGIVVRLASIEAHAEYDLRAHTSSTDEDLLTYWLIERLDLTQHVTESARLR